MRTSLPRYGQLTALCAKGGYMHRLARHRPLVLIGLIALILTGSCAVYRSITTNPYSKSHLGPDSSALVILDTRILGLEVPEAQPQTIIEGILDALWDELWGLSDSEELRQYELKIESGVLAVGREGGGQTVPGITTKGHLVFMDVPPGVIQLASIRGYREMSAEGKKHYNCESDAGCPQIWLYKYPMEAIGVANLGDSVRVGEVLYLGHLDAVGLYPQPPYDHPCHGTTESNNFLGFDYQLTWADCWTVDVVRAEVSSTVQDQKLALKDIHDRIKNKEWKEILKASMVALEASEVPEEP